MTSSDTASETKLLRLYLGLFALAAVALLLLAARLRFLVPSRRPSRVRDLMLAPSRRAAP